jgi:hypothetical protein
VSEEIRNRSLGNPWEGRLPKSDAARPYSRSQDTGANRHHQQSLSRDKEDCMRVLRAVVSLALLSLPAFAADLKIKVVDPNSVAVAGAEVSVFPQGQSAPSAVVLTSSEGVVSIPGLEDGAYRVQVLAPGFAAKTLDASIPQSSAFTVNLAIAATSELVVVTATRTPLPEQESGASVSTLENGQLQVMQPVAASDAVRFLSGSRLCSCEAGIPATTKSSSTACRSTIPEEFLISALSQFRAPTDWSSFGGRRARFTGRTR